MKGAFNNKTHIYTKENVSTVIEYGRMHGVRVIPEFDTPVSKLVIVIAFFPQDLFPFSYFVHFLFGCWCNVERAHFPQILVESQTIYVGRGC